MSPEAVAAVTVSGCHERRPQRGVEYTAFVDPSGGSNDSMTLAIAHREGQIAVLDCLRERRAPFNPSEVVAEFAQVLRPYRVTVVIGDRYGGEWPAERFREHHVSYDPADLVTSDYYLELLSLVNSARVQLLDHPRMLAQLLSLERRTSRLGRDTIDHPLGAHDDVINAAAGALVSVNTRLTVQVLDMDDDDEPTPGGRDASRSASRRHALGKAVFVNASLAG